MQVSQAVAGAVLHPVRTFRALASEAGAFATGLKAALLLGALFSVAAGALALADGLAFAPAVLKIPPQNYYFWEMLFALPVVLAAWLLAGAAAHLLARQGGGRGSLGRTLGALGPAFAAPGILLWLPSAALAVALALGVPQERIMELTVQPGLGQSAALGYPVLAVLWMAALASDAAREIHKLRVLPALMSGLAATVCFTAVFILFIR